MAEENSRPILVTLLAVLYFIAGIGLVLFAAAVLLGGVAIEEAELGALGAGGILIGGIVLLTLYYGFWKGWNIFWYIGIIVSVLTIVMGLYTLFILHTGGILDIVVGLIILLYLRSEKVKKFFLD